MNKFNNKSLGKRSTNTASLSNAISSIKSSISPILQTGRVTGHPKPLKANNEMWIPRTVRLYRIGSSSADFTSTPTLADVYTAAGITGQIRVLGLKVWNFTNAATSSNYIQVDTPVGLTETAVTTSVNDLGNASHLAGVHVTIPRTIASNLVTSTTAGSLCSIVGVPPGITSSFSESQKFVVDVHFEYKTDVTN